MYYDILTTAKFVESIEINSSHFDRIIQNKLVSNPD